MINFLFYFYDETGTVSSLCDYTQTKFLINREITVCYHRKNIKKKLLKLGYTARAVSSKIASSTAGSLRRASAAVNMFVKD